MAQCLCVSKLMWIRLLVREEIMGPSSDSWKNLRSSSEIRTNPHFYVQCFCFAGFGRALVFIAILTPHPRIYSYTGITVGDSKPASTTVTPPEAWAGATAALTVFSGSQREPEDA